MKRRTCVIALSAQAVLVSGMAISRIAYLNELIDLAFGNVLFSILVFPLLALMPFGVISLILSIGAKLLMRSEVLKFDRKDRFASGAPETMLVWREIVESIQVSNVESIDE